MEGRGGKKRNFNLNDEVFIKTIFSWSIEDIMNEGLYTNEVKLIPDSFESANHYFSSFVYPLLEETRAQLCSSLEFIQRSPFSELISFEECKSKSTPSEESESSSSKLYDVQVHGWQNRFSGRGKESYKTLPGDVFVLVDAKPETAADLERVGWSWSFVIVMKLTENGDEDGGESTRFKVKALRDLEFFTKTQRSLFLVFLTNITTNKRMWNGLHLSGNLQIVNKALRLNSTDGGEFSMRSMHIDENFDLTLLSQLNESQLNAVRSCLDEIKCGHKSAIQLIWGPPGTGKTKSVIMLLVLLSQMKLRTLVCAPTNVAVVELATRVVREVEKGRRSDSFLCPLGDILLFGNNERLKVGCDVDDIYLNHRVQKLVECCSPSTGWRNCITTMLSFLEDSVAQNVNGTEINDGIHQSFLEFARKQFARIALPLKDCLSKFCRHLPKDFMLERNVRKIEAVISHLDSFESLLFKYAVNSEALKEKFSHPISVEGPSQSSIHFPDELNSKRSDCFSVLQDLQSSLSDLKLLRGVNIKAIKEFCFQNASLVFCTASSSDHLHSLKLKPLDILVIDEAAQLKECESCIPLQIPGIKHAVFTGDECQLQAMVESRISQKAGFGRSLFERLSSLGHSRHLLNKQYRMHPAISFFPNRKFYNNMIFDGPNVSTNCYEKRYLPGYMFGPYSFINVIGGREEKDDAGHSLRNMVEVAIVLKIVRSLYKGTDESDWNGEKLSIGVISPYKDQVVAIEAKLGRRYDDINDFSVKVKSADGFQGGEEDIIIISTVRSNSRSSIGFVSNPQRTNVALTRARHCLWILGSEKTLGRSGSVWEDLVLDAKKRNCFFNADQNEELSKVIIQVKKELDHLDDLLDENSILFREAKWKILFSYKFLKSFKKLLSKQTKKSVLNLLMKISSGWRPKRRIRDSVCGSSSQILQQFKVESLYVICAVDIVKESTYTQVMKIWDILPLENIPKLVKQLESTFESYSDDYLNCCREICSEGNLEVPKSWTPLKEIVRFKLSNDNESGSDGRRSLVEKSKVSDSLLLMKFYSLSFGVVSHLLSDRDGVELDLPLEVNDQELEIILYPKSTFVLGRSGTGKTTVLTMKLYQKEKLHLMGKEFVHGGIKGRDSFNENEVEESSHGPEDLVLRQLFVTVSPKLCYAVKKHVLNLKSYLSGGSNTAGSSKLNLGEIDEINDQFNDVPDSFIDLPSKFYPLVISFHKFLMMLDGTLGNSFFGRFHDLRELLCQSGKHSRSVAMQTFMKTREVNYDRFSSSYWPHFNSKQTKLVDCSRAFTEIISYIKGHSMTTEAGTGKLVREDYVALSDSRASSLSKPMRENIYAIYQTYEKMKMKNGDFDLADLVMDLHHRIRDQQYGGDLMDFVYIDEVQDLTMSQVALFKYVCNNVDDGFIFSGDTAQTISRGIDFRFQDIKSLFYSQFVLRSELDKRNQKGQISEMFQLSQNFRTHAGILNLSHSIIELLYRFFPYAIDILKPETSLIHGELPVLLKFGDSDNAMIKIFGNNSMNVQNIVEFGAEQVILVRDESTRNEILNYVGEQALVLTILECKGLEFQDVLLYNFFGSSPLKNQWRVVYNFMEEQGLLENFTAKYPCFKESKHNIMCSELKQLYVAVTRTRQRLWFWENENEHSEPMFDYWKKKGLVQVCQLDDSLVQKMIVGSTHEQWKEQGMKLYNERNYEMATRCFEKARDTYWERRSRASCLKARADSIRHANHEEADAFLREAAEIFDAIGKADFAAQCYFELRYFEKAGTIFLEKFGESELNKAGECFALAGCFERAAEIYARGNFFSECLDVCSKGNLFDVGLQYIHCWKNNALQESGVNEKDGRLEKMAQQFLESCALHYHRSGDNRSMMKFINDFHSTDLMRNFLKSLDCLDELLLLEEETGNFLQAAYIAKKKGDIIRQADLLGKAEKFEDASVLILQFVLANSLWSSGGKGWPLKEFSQKEQLLEKAKAFAKNVSSSFYEYVCVEADILLSQENDFIIMKDWFFLFNSSKNVQGEFLAVRKILDFHLGCNASEYTWEDKFSSDTVTHAEKISMETMVFFWEFWRDNTLKIFDFLGKDWTDGVDEYGKFCWSFLGVSREIYKQNEIYFLLNSDAYWVRDVGRKSVRKNSQLVSLDVCYLISSASSYWRSEMLDLGLNILRTLGELYQLSTKNSLSLFLQSRSLLHIFEVAKFLLETKHLDRSQNESQTLRNYVELAINNFVKCAFPLDSNISLDDNMISLRSTAVAGELLHRTLENLRYLSTKTSLALFLRSTSLIHIFEVAKFLLETKHLEHSHDESQTLQNYIEIAIDNFVNCVFPLDSNLSLDENMISLRSTPLAGELLQRFIAEDTSSINSPTSHGQFGRVAMIILGSAKLSSQPFESIMKWSDDCQTWKLFFQHLREVDNHPDISLVWRFHQALNETYGSNWVKERDYITPFCFLYLLERILIMASSSFNGYFITSKSSFVEWLTYYRGDYKLSSNLPLDLDRYLEATIGFLVDVSRECLINKQQMIDWLIKSRIKVKEYYPTLVLRFFIIICLLHVNFGVRLDLLYDILGKNYVTDHLPLEFCNTLRRGRRDNVLNNFAEAFRKTGNPMVIVNVGGKQPMFMSRDAISVDMRDVRSVEDVLEILFPKVVEDEEKAIVLNPPSGSSSSEDNGPEHVSGVLDKKLSKSALTEHREGGDQTNLVSTVDAVKVDTEENADAKTREIEEISLEEDLSTEELSFSDEKIEQLSEMESDVSKLPAEGVRSSAVGTGSGNTNPLGAILTRQLNN